MFNSEMQHMKIKQVPTLDIKIHQLGHYALMSTLQNWKRIQPDFHKDLDTNKANFIIRKGFRKNIDSYSGFFENDRTTSTGLNGILKSLKIKRVFVVGLALDFCVQYTAIDSTKLGYETYVIENATLPVSIGNSVKDALNNFKEHKVNFGKLEEFI